MARASGTWCDWSATAVMAGAIFLDCAIFGGRLTRPCGICHDVFAIPFFLISQCHITLAFYSCSTQALIRL